MTHRQIYNKAKEYAKKHHEFISLLCNLELDKFGFEHGDTDSDGIIDTISYSTQDVSFDDYKKEMEFYKKAFDETGSVKGLGYYKKS